MIVHPPIRILFIADKDDSSLQSLLSYLRSIPHVELALEAQVPGDLTAYDVVATADTTALVDYHEQLTKFVYRGGGWSSASCLTIETIPWRFAWPMPCISKGFTSLWLKGQKRQKQYYMLTGNTNTAP